MNRAWEKLYDAVRALALGEGDIRHRLWRAFADGLVKLSPEAVPADIRPRFQEILSALRDPNGVDSVEKVTARMRTEQAEEIGGLIVDLYGEVCRRMK